MLRDKLILLGICGGIAAYKSAELSRLIVREGGAVQVVMTDAAKEFISPLTMHGLTGRPVLSSLFDEGRVNATEHIRLAREPDLIIVAPATANILGKAAVGIADDLLSTVLMAVDLQNCPVILAPSMNTTMFANPAVQGNIRTLAERGFVIADPGSGDLACGEIGKGRMAEPTELLNMIKERFQAADTGKDYAGLNLLISAGPTREALDPMRFISNYSSGKMGYALALAAAERGAGVTLVSGPVNLQPPPGVRFFPVVSALEMYDVMMEQAPGADIIIKTAAVADYRPEKFSGQKIKKAGDMQIKLVRNPDILKELGAKKTKQFLVGFAAETEKLLEYAKQKMIDKNLDMIVANDLLEKGAGFQADTNIVRLLYKEGNVEEIPIMTKQKLAHLILDRILTKTVDSGQWSVVS